MSDLYYQQAIDILNHVKAWRDCDGNDGFPHEVRERMDALLAAVELRKPKAGIEKPDLVARGMSWAETEEQMKLAFAQAGREWGPPPDMGINIMQRLANNAHRAGFTEVLSRISEAPDEKKPGYNAGWYAGFDAAVSQPGRENKEAIGRAVLEALQGAELGPKLLAGEVLRLLEIVYQNENVLREARNVVSYEFVMDTIKSVLKRKEAK